MRRYCDDEVRRGSKKRLKVQRLKTASTYLATLPDTVDLRVLLERYYSEAGVLLKWLRRQLLDLSSEFNARKLESWIEDPDRQ